MSWVETPFEALLTNSKDGEWGKGEEAIGHLYLLRDGKYLIEIVALATEPNRGALKICRESANSLSRGPAKKR